MVNSDGEKRKTGKLRTPNSKAVIASLSNVSQEHMLGRLTIYGGSKNKNYAVLLLDSNTTRPATDRMKAAKAWRVTRHSKSFLGLSVIDR